MVRKLFAFILAAVLSFPLSAQEQPLPPSRHAVPGHRYLKEYWGRSGQYLEHQAYYMLDLANQAFNRNPPSPKVSLEREMGFLMLDAVAHEPTPKENPAVLDYIATRMNLVIEDLNKPLKRKNSLRIYKLYNCGMIFRTRDMVVAVDLNGRHGALIPDEIMGRIVDKIDILFYTHNHGDHFDRSVRDLCHQRNIPIYATDEVFKNDDEVHHVWFEGQIRDFDIDLPKGKLNVFALPGHQDKLHNNIWVITLPNRKVVAATGDQWLDDGSDRVWLKDIYKKLPKIDVLAMDCWIHDYEEHLADFSPRLLISQHENEIGAHGIDHREAYWMTLYKNDKIYQIGTPYVLMSWGEWYDYK